MLDNWRYGMPPKIGEVYMMQFSGDDNVLSGWRPGIVLQNNIGNLYSPNVIALPITTSLKKLTQPTHVLLLAEETGLLMDSMVLCENPETISKARIGRFLTTLPDEHMRRVALASVMATSAIAFLAEHELHKVWQTASRLNEVVLPDVNERQKY